MKNIQLLVAMMAAVLFLPSITHASTIQLPSTTVVIDDAQYKTLFNRGACYMPGEGQASNCDDIAPYLHRPLLHSEEGGALYFASLDGGGVAIESYLPNGFYKTVVRGKNRYFYTHDGVRVRLRKGSAYATVVRAAQNGMVTPLSSEDKRLLQTTCEYYDQYSDAHSYDAYLECVSRYERGQVLEDRLIHSMLLDVSAGGRLLQFSQAGELVIMAKRMNGKKFFQYVKSNATEVSRSQIFSVRGLNQ